MSTKMQVQWRRAKVQELSRKGYSQIDIATQLQADEPTISRDMAYLRKEAKETLEKHLNEIVPEEYQKCMIGMKRNLKQTLEIGESSPDPKIKLEARRIAIDCYRYIMDLCTNAGVV
jgi:IS30 family transposase